MTAPAGNLVLLYDGRCGFCDRTVQFILRHDRRGAMQFAPLEGAFAREVLARHPALAGVDSLVLVERGGVEERERVTVRSEAVLKMLRYLGWPWRAFTAFRAVPRLPRDWLYDRFARIRYRVFGRFDACPIPLPEVRSRFLP